MELIALIFSGISLVISAVTVYLTQFRPSAIKCIVGSVLHIFYEDFSDDNKFSLNFYLPVSYVNTSSRTGTIFTTALVIHRKDTPEQQFFMRAETFGELVDNGWSMTGVATPIVVSGKSSETRIIKYYWDSESEPRFILREGGYVVTLYYWESQNNRPKISTHEMFVDETTIKKLDSYRKREIGGVVQQGLDKQLGKNKLMTEHEKSALLN